MIIFKNIKYHNLIKIFKHNNINISSGLNNSKYRLNLLEYKLSNLLNILYKEQAYDVVKRSNHISKIIETNKKPITFQEYLEYFKNRNNISNNKPLVNTNITRKQKNKNHFFNSDELKKIKIKVFFKLFYNLLLF